ncbi:hypothetical protein K503DRAFT_86980 [Rhizopogon vinicolor AM-OR11-026]|uniref:Uncharacterized protein n=1 Tax=Rhizopogon vinicolor AM-OR11-026 TaxID=1314800 RepID=A0A1B7MFN9_9AGAM|nr:hypothetical protein K503DRAFT_86980 [Rhizopogon vinicolor AM-OR11-026]
MSFSAHAVEFCGESTLSITYNQPVFLQCIQSYSITWSYITSHELCVSLSLSLLLLWQHLCLLVLVVGTAGFAFLNPIAAMMTLFVCFLSAYQTDGLAGSMLTCHDNRCLIDQDIASR